MSLSSGRRIVRCEKSCPQPCNTLACFAAALVVVVGRGQVENVFHWSFSNTTSTTHSELKMQAVLSDLDRCRMVFGSFLHAAKGRCSVPKSLQASRGPHLVFPFVQSNTSEGCTLACEKSRFTGSDWMQREFPRVARSPLTDRTPGGTHASSGRQPACNSKRCVERSRLSLATCTARRPVVTPGVCHEQLGSSVGVFEALVEAVGMGVKEVLKDCLWRLSDWPLCFQYSPPSEGPSASLVIDERM